MTVFALLAILVWVPLVIVLFAIRPPRQALAASVLAGWLFLPQLGFRIEGFVDFTKATVVPLAALLGAVLFAPERVTSFRPKWFDVPMIVWCLAPGLSAITNGFGLYGGLNQSLYQTITWGVPYFLGRALLCDTEGLRTLAVAVVLAGLVYVPLCLYEIRMSQQLHRIVYGFHFRGFGGVRLEGYRPEVFMNTGLELGLWMTACSITAIWLWRTRSIKSFCGLPAGLAAIVVLFTTVLCRSTGALALLAVGVSVLFVLRQAASRWALIVLLALAPAYVLARGSGIWDGSDLVAVARAMLPEGPVASLEGRIRNDSLYVDRAKRKPVFGWSSWDRAKPRSASGKLIAPDGYWVIVFAQTGLVGLVSWLSAVMLPAVLLVKRLPGRLLRSADYAPAVALAAVTVLFTIDCLFNAMLNPIYILAMGALAGAGLNSSIATARQHGVNPVPGQPA